MRLPVPVAGPDMPKALRHRAFWPTLVALLALGAVAVTIVVPNREVDLSVLLPAAAVAAIWMAASTRYPVTLVAVALYIALIDGYLKLRVGGAGVTAIRDVLLGAIVAGIAVRLIAGRLGVAVPGLTEAFETGAVVGPPPPRTQQDLILAAALPLAWTAVVLLELVNPHNGTLLHSLAALRPHLEFVPLFFLGFLVLRTRRRVKTLLVLLLAVAAVNGVVATVQSTLTPAQLAQWGPGYKARITGSGDVSPRRYIDAEGHFHPRPPALGSDMGFGGSLALLAIPGGFVLLWLNRRRRAVWWIGGLLGAALLGVASSASRSAVLGAVVGLLVLPFLLELNRRRLIVLGAVSASVLVLGTLAFLGLSRVEPAALDRFASITPTNLVTTVYDYRKDVAPLIPQYASTYPFGAGLGSVGPGASVSGGANVSLNSESEFTYLLVETGVAGLVVMLVLTLRLVALAATRIRRVADEEMQLLLAALAAPIVALFVLWWSGPITSSTPDSPYFWFAGGALTWWLAGSSWARPASPVKTSRQLLWPRGERRGRPHEQPVERLLLRDQREHDQAQGTREGDSGDGPSDSGDLHSTNRNCHDDG
jgi:hypothetical protein